MRSLAVQLFQRKDKVIKMSQKNYKNSDGIDEKKPLITPSGERYDKNKNKANTYKATDVKPSFQSQSSSSSRPTQIKYVKLQGTPSPSPQTPAQKKHSKNFPPTLKPKRLSFK